MKTLQLIFVLLLCAFADNVGVWEECANIGVWDGCTAEAPTSWDSLLFDSTGIKLNSVEIKLTIIDTIYWHDTLILWHNEAYVDSFKIGDSNCMVINVDSLKTYVIVDSGIQSGYVNFILIDTVSSDTCNNPDSVWLESTYRPIPIFLTQLDTSQVGSTQLILIGSLLSDSGVITFQQTQDTNSTITDISNSGSVNSPYEFRDTVTGLTPSDSLYFRAIFVSDIGSATDTTNWFLVVMKDTFPGITVQPASDSVYNWKNAYLTIGATGTEPLTKTWQKRNGDWQTVGTGDSLTVSPLDTMTTYRVLVTSPWGADTSDTANITFFEPVSRRYSWIDSTLTASGLTVPDSVNVGAKINNLNLTLTKWSGGQVIGTVPSGTPAGLYKSPGLWLYQFTGEDTTAIDTLGAVRVLKFQVRSVE